MRASSSSTSLSPLSDESSLSLRHFYLKRGIACALVAFVLVLASYWYGGLYPFEDDTYIWASYECGDLHSRLETWRSSVDSEGEVDFKKARPPIVSKFASQCRKFVQQYEVCKEAQIRVIASREGQGEESSEEIRTILTTPISFSPLQPSESHVDISSSGFVLPSMREVELLQGVFELEDQSPIQPWTQVDTYTAFSWVVGAEAKEESILYGCLFGTPKEILPLTPTLRQIKIEGEEVAMPRTSVTLANMYSTFVMTSTYAGVTFNTGAPLQIILVQPAHSTEYPTKPILRLVCLGIASVLAFLIGSTPWWRVTHQMKAPEEGGTKPVVESMDHLSAADQEAVARVWQQDAIQERDEMQLQRRRAVLSAAVSPKEEGGEAEVEAKESAPKKTKKKKQAKVN